MVDVGLAVGGVWGLKEGVTRPLGTRSNFRLRLNSVLNGCTRRGTLLGNSLGVLGEAFSKMTMEYAKTLVAIFYNLTNSSLDSARGRHDVWNSMAAAAASGAIYKSTGRSGREVRHSRNTLIQVLMQLVCDHHLLLRVSCQVPREDGLSSKRSSDIPSFVALHIGSIG